MSFVNTTVPSISSVTQRFSPVSSVALSALAIPNVAQAAQPSLLYQAFDGGVVGFLSTTMAALGTARVAGGIWVHRSLKSKLQNQNFDTETFQKKKPSASFGSAVPFGILTVSFGATSLFCSVDNFEMATLAALVGASALALESVFFLGRTYLAYRSSQRKVVTIEDREEAKAKYNAKLEERITDLKKEVETLNAKSGSKFSVTAIKNREPIEALQAEIEVLEIWQERLKSEKYADILKSVTADIGRYFEDLSEEDLTESDEKIQRTQTQIKASNREV